ncbi:MAG: hypothetical protein JXA64_02060 [Candidatus Fermentibacteraceae bacterium]|nr:hypothetical protein [Candidatus Fermentibacteraceae bacterium]
MKSILLSLVLAIMPAVLLGESITVNIPLDPSRLCIVDRGVCTSVTHSMGYTTYSPGVPSLPILPVQVALPTGCRATGLQIVDAVYSSVDGSHYITPSSGCFPVSLPEPAVQSEPDAHIYTRDAFYPAATAQLSSSGVLWGIPVAYMTVFPARWNPVTGELEVLSELTVEVEYESDPSTRLVSRRTEASEQRAMDIVRNMVVNPGGVSHSGAVMVEPRELAYGQYVIVTCPEYEDVFNDLAMWKTAKGIPTSVYSTGWVQANYSFWDLQQDIRAFLTDCRDQGTDYVLIAGDDDRVECRDAHMATFGYVEDAPCDLYFSDINDTQPGADRWDINFNHVWGEDADSIDYHPDLWVGRASVNSMAEAELWVRKVLFYEHMTGWSGLDYFDTAPVEMRMGHSTELLFSPDYYGAASAEMISACIPPEWGIEKCYQLTGNNSYTITNDMFNAGPHHVYVAAHGSPTSFSVPGGSYTTGDAMNLTNISAGNSVAILNGICCSTGHLDGNESFSDAWQASPNGGGFVAMNAREGWGHYGDPGMGPSERICEQFYYQYLLDGCFELGVAHLTAMDYFTPPSAFADSFELQGSEVETLDWCLKTYNLFGDPELPMWTLEAMDLSVSHTASISEAGIIEVDVQSGGSPLENARVCLQKGDWQTGDIYEVDYTDASGSASIYVNPETTGTIDIHVWAHNHNTYAGTIDVTGTGIAGNPGEICSYCLSPVSPSPAMSIATVRFSLAQAGHARVDVFDLSGRAVATLASGELAAGSHSLVWNLLDDSGMPVPSGLYHVRVSSGSFCESASLVVIR